MYFLAVTSLRYRRADSLTVFLKYNLLYLLCYRHLVFNCCLWVIPFNRAYVWFYCLVSCVRIDLRQKCINCMPFQMRVSLYTEVVYISCCTQCCCMCHADSSSSISSNSIKQVDIAYSLFDGHFSTLLFTSFNLLHSHELGTRCRLFRRYQTAYSGFLNFFFNTGTVVRLHVV